MLKIMNKKEEILAYIEYFTLFELIRTYDLEDIFHEEVKVVA